MQEREPGLTPCFHCALPVPPGTDYAVELDGLSRAVCCPGCKAVAELIRDAGMTGYYAMREAPPPGTGRPAADAAGWETFNRDEMLASFAVREDDCAEATIYVGGMYCAACSWLVESTLDRIEGVERAEVSPITHRLRVRFRVDATGLGDILAALTELGYEPQPLLPEAGERPEVGEQRAALKRLLVASLGMMQVMMFAIGLYAGDYQGMSADMQRFLRYVSLVVTTPVVFYSARPFFVAAWRGIVSRAPGMDLPVSIAIGAAYLASVYATLTDGRAVWFDSVTMFVFFLTLGRFLEMRARHRSVDRLTALSTVLPNTAERIGAAGRETVSVSRLVAGDRVLVRTGEAVPADGIVVAGSARVDEALVTGESRPVMRTAGESVVAGSVNVGDALEMRVVATGNDTTLGAISRLSERARYARPAFVQIADRIASALVVAILVIAAGVAAAWSQIAPERAFEITLSVLVVTCPCALALATPAAFAAAGTRLAELRLLLTNGNAIEVLARAGTVLFDKTGTVTRGRPAIVRVDLEDRDFDEDYVRRVAAALETVSTHPLAQAFAIGDNPLVATDPTVDVGRGVAGTVAGRHWRLGRRDYVAGSATDLTPDEATVAWLGTGGRLVARFVLDDPLRPDAAEHVAALEALGLRTGLLSGDGDAPVARAARQLGISAFRARLRPEDKLAAIRALQGQGETVVMVGDGINDAPVLAGADASIAPAHGAMLAQLSADVILLGDSLEPVVTCLRMARRTMRIVRQNLGWAIVYNATALPLAAAGFVPPWAAAIGMSASSLIVVLNALRLARFR
ncbi:MAG: heavy metal translocating P-type ATPase [Woeseiaceae bacterium]|nr:heavy metal translocating P-type ATPase [Woeseiaceae bacterium]